MTRNHQPARLTGILGVSIQTGFMECLKGAAVLFLLTTCGMAQTAGLSVGAASGSAGATADLLVSFSAGAISVSSLQFDLLYPSSLSYVATVTGSAAGSAGKTASGSAVPGGTRVLVFGFNQTAIGPGPVATVQLSIVAGATPGAIPVTISNLSASDPLGNSVALLGSSGSITVLDTARPAVTITSPTASGNYTTTATPLNISGTASDNVAVTQVTWTNDRSGSGIASGTASWSASGIALQSGSNIITVTAKDAANNSATTTLTVSYTPPDTTAPVVAIAFPTASETWTTTTTPLSIGGTASDNVAVTQVAWSNSRGARGTASGTADWSASGVALQTGSNVITVTAKDAAGNSGSASLTVTFAPTDTAPPVLSSISASVRATSAVVSWTTNEPADSQIDFGTSMAYAKSTALDANPVTSHAQTLTGLTARTAYHFRIKSRDSSGNLTVSPDYTFKTGSSDSTSKVVFYYPRPNSGHKQRAVQDSDDEYVAIALTNLDASDATLTFTAYKTSGALVSGVNVANPVTRTLKPGEQMPVIDVQLFGSGITGAGPVGWIQVESSTSKLTGFFMAFDSRLSLLDGAELSTNVLHSFVLPEVADGDITRIQLANPNEEPASVRVDLIRADGTLRASSTQTIQALGTLSADLRGEIFAGIAAEPSDYVKVVSTRGLIPYEILSRAAGDIALLSGLDSSGGVGQLYSPQYVVGGAWSSTLSIVNLDETPGVLMLKLIADDGSQIGPAQFVAIAGRGKVRISDRSFFGVLGPDQVMQGYVEVTGLGLRLAGNVVFSDAAQGRFTSALPMVSVLGKSAIFSHVASNETYFTGLAILNPNQTPAFATIDLYGSNGTLAASTTVTIPARRRKSALLSEYFPGLAGQAWTSGYFRVTVDNWVACFALFGTNDLGVLSAIPGQPVP